MSPIITSDSITFSYADNPVLSNISFTINPGDFVALMGMNGAGKSTLLNILHGSLSPKEGSIYFNEKYINRKNPYASIGFSAQRLIADWFLTVLDNVIMGGLLSGYSYKNSKEMAMKALDQVGISDKYDYQMDTLSGGQQQRVQIARAIVHNPQIYILDEPTTGLDAQYAENIFSFLKEEQKQGKTIIVSSHDLYLLEKYCNKLIYLDKGKLNYFGNLKDFLKTHRPIIRYQIDLKRTYQQNDSLPISFFLRDKSNNNSSNFIEIEIIGNHSLSDALIEISQNNEIVGIKNLSESGLRNFFVAK